MTNDKHDPNQNDLDQHCPKNLMELCKMHGIKPAAPDNPVYSTPFVIGLKGRSPQRAIQGKPESSETGVQPTPSQLKFINRNSRKPDESS